MNKNNIEIIINSGIDNVIKQSSYTRDNLLCFAVSAQPHFIVWSAALALNGNTKKETKKIGLENATEELFGIMGEGSHASLAHCFFEQIGNFESSHYKKTREEINSIYEALGNHKIMLSFLTCTEMWSSVAMPLILEAMKQYGATDFQYVEVHAIADNTEDGHSIKFLNALVLESPTKEEIEKGVSLFENLFGKIFS